MEVSYKKLWKILIDRDMKKKDLQAKAGISWASVTKLSKGETVSMEVLMKVSISLQIRKMLLLLIFLLDLVQPCTLSIC